VTAVEEKCESSECTELDIILWMIICFSYIAKELLSQLLACVFFFKLCGLKVNDAIEGHHVK
jgi:hypothetical protein